MYDPSAADELTPEEEEAVRAGARLDFQRAQFPPEMPDEDAARKAASAVFKATALPNDKARAAAAAAPVMTKVEPPRPPASPMPGVTLTDRSGGLDTTVVAGTGEPVVKSQSVTTMERTGKAATAGEKDIQKEALEEEKKALKVAEQRGEVERKRAEVDAVNANYGAALKEVQDAERKEALRKQEETYKDLKAKADQEYESYRKDAEDTQKGLTSDGWWSTRSTGQKIAAGIAMIAGVIGGMQDGSNVGVDAVNAAMEKDFANQRERLALRKENVAKLKGDKTEFIAEADRALKALDLKHAGALDSAAAKAEALMRQMGVPDAEIKKNEAIANLRKQALDRRQKYEEGLRQDVFKPITTTTRVKLDGGAAGGGKGPGANALDDIVRIEGDVQDLDALMRTIKENPKAYEEYKDAMQSWKRAEAASKAGAGSIRGLAQMTGLAAAAPDENLKSEAARAIYRGISKLESSMAKSYGGAITDGDRDSARASLSALTAKPGEFLKTLGDTRKKWEGAYQRYAAPRGAAPGARPAGTLPPSPAAGPQLSAQDIEAIKWARANANDPKHSAKAREILSLHGM